MPGCEKEPVTVDMRTPGGDEGGFLWDHRVEGGRTGGLLALIGRSRKRPMSFYKYPGSLLGLELKR